MGGDEVDFKRTVQDIELILRLRTLFAIKTETTIEIHHVVRVMQTYTCNVSLFYAAIHVLVHAASSYATTNDSRTYQIADAMNPQIKS